MYIVKLSEAKKRLSEPVERAACGERIGITKHGKLAVVIGPASNSKVDLRREFDEIEKIRKPSKKVSRITTKSLIEKAGFDSIP
jgi:prevent-host-death family protein